MTTIKEELDNFLKENINKSVTKALNSINKNYKEKNVNVLNFEDKAKNSKTNSIKKTFLNSFHKNSIKDENVDEYFNKMLQTLQNELKQKKEESLRRRVTKSKNKDYSEVKKPKEGKREGFNDISLKYKGKKYEVSVKSTIGKEAITDFTKSIVSPDESKIKNIFHSLISKRDFLILNEGSSTVVYEYNTNKMKNLIIEKSGSRNFTAKSKEGNKIYTFESRSGNAYRFKLHHRTARKNGYIVPLKKEEQERIKKELKL